MHAFKNVCRCWAGIEAMATFSCYSASHICLLVSGIAETVSRESYLFKCEETTTKILPGISGSTKQRTSKMKALTYFINLFIVCLLFCLTSTDSFSIWTVPSSLLSIKLWQVEQAPLNQAVRTLFNSASYSNGTLRVVFKFQKSIRFLETSLVHFIIPHLNTVFLKWSSSVREFIKNG